MKNLKTLSLFLFFSTILIQSYAQSRFSGQVLSKSDSSYIEGAQIYILPSNKGVTSDNNGNFDFEFNEKIENLKVKSLGYKDTIIALNTQSGIKSFIIYLQKQIEKIDDVVVTANRLPQSTKDVPGRVDLVSKDLVESFAATNVDDLLRTVANVNVNRSWGIFSRNSAVNLRGLDGSARVLILLDGVPLNKSAGGSINWHLIRPEKVKRIEVVKGPSSSIYGNNSMTGVINIITKRPTQKLSTEVGLFAGSFGTYGGNLQLGGNHKKLYWTANGFYRKGDGYKLLPEEQRDSTSIDAFLEEKNASLLVGYNINDRSTIEFEYSHHNDKRSEGVAVYTNDGTYNKITTNYFRLNFKTEINKYKLEAKGFYHNEKLFDYDEKINNSGFYKFSEKKQKSNDLGVWLTVSKQLNSNNLLIGGVDFKNGYLTADDIYKTSTDLISREGHSNYGALFLQHELKFFKDKLQLVSGLRVDYSEFYDGHIEVETPTSETGFKEEVNMDYEKDNWLALSPKIALKYTISPKFGSYVSVSKGFMPPKLDDLCSSRKIRKGFKVANPELKPEFLTNYEIGFDFNPIEKLDIKTSFYYSKGKDFQYMFATGELIEAGGDDVIVMKKDNISEVTVLGAELSINYKINDYLKWSGFYNFNNSYISDFPSLETQVDLTDKKLMEVPENQFGTHLLASYKKLRASLSYSYVGAQWFDDENKVKVDSYDFMDFKLTWNIFKYASSSIIVQNIFDNQFIDKKGLLSPGRFMVFKLKFRI